MNVDKQIGKWVYCLIKYGDVYLRLYRESDYHDVLFNKVDRTKQALNEAVNLSIHNTNDNYSYYVEMVPDPSTMFELTRHGQTEWNVLKKVQGKANIALNETGENQALITAQNLIDEEIDLIISSPLKRALQTAEIINKTNKSTNVTIIASVKFIINPLHT